MPRTINRDLCVVKAAHGAAFHSKRRPFMRARGLILRPPARGKTGLFDDADEALSLKVQDDLLRRFAGAENGCVDGYFRVLRRFVGV